ncbi:MAG: DNA polymerase III subunit chi [Gammaproteobacteria bacterium]|nr:DNA polymerase III subunit chi [Gammaproteobacteria bacterium]MYE51999.1 DNA polymerase III subunit chi [Gammaproteobacteria bacterium]MYF50675.1 DNA polymerase III subunit chi [Gammaproteobacteria bacterium]MYH14823.1 DNA polymerase III subunit chi [Gammaproteobacteria bacterium]MYK82231.1 DNA polymerase III subunit chi [Gammaproteobacteria bacterium]
MTRLDFYILQDVERQAMLRFACRLAAKAAAAGKPIYVHAQSGAEAEEFDELLWCYPPNRMIPHGLVGQPAAEDAPVVVGSAPELAKDRDWTAQGLLINLSDEAPAFIDQFERAAEIIVGENRSSGRARYRLYRDRGYALSTHELDNWEGT